MRRHLNRLGLSLLLTLGVISWNQQQSSSFSRPLPLLVSIAQTAAADQQLLEAVKANHLDAAAAALAKGANPNVGNAHTGYALAIAASQGEVDMLQLLLDRGAMVNRQTDEGYTALMEAVLTGQTAAARVLLDHHANPNLTAAGMTPLSVAVSNGNEALVRLLVASGADVEQPAQGKNALQLAQAQGNPKIIALVEAVNHGAN